MSEDLDVLIGATEGEGPSADFVARLRAEVLAEASAPYDQPGIAEIDVTEPRPVRSVDRRPPWTQLSLAAAAAVVLIVCVFALRGGQDDDAQLETTGSPGPALPGDPIETATPLNRWDTFLQEGTYRLDNLGTSVVFTTPEPLVLSARHTGSNVLSHAASTTTDERRLAIMRLSALSNPAEPAVPLESYDDGWPANDFAGWLESLAPGIVATNAAELSIGGHEAIRVDLTLGDIECGNGAACASLGTNWLVHTMDLNLGVQYRVWVIEQDGEAPLAMVASSAPRDQQMWFETADQIVSTMTLGNAMPHPTSLNPPGPVEHQLLGGVRFALDRSSVTVENSSDFSMVPYLAHYAAVLFLENPFDHQGNAVQSIDDLVEYLGNGAELTELGSERMGAFDARVFDIVGGASPWVQLLSSPEAPEGLSAPGSLRIWAVEHPDRGLLVVYAAAMSSAEDVYPEVVAEATALVASLEFIELD